MSFLVIAVCLALQWFLNLSSASYQRAWAIPYSNYMQKRFSALLPGHRLFTLLLLVLPILIAISIVFTLLYHLFGQTGYRIASLLFLWYCVDVLCMKPSADDVSMDVLFLQSYQKVFALLAWYFVFGPVGLSLYVSVAAFRAAELDPLFTTALGILDWVPLRLLGLSFALAGDFGAVFKRWIQALPMGIVDHQNQAVEWGVAALTSKKANPLSDAASLVQRALCIWLMAMFLITLGFWLG